MIKRKLSGMFLKENESFSTFFFQSVPDFCITPYLIVKIIESKA